MHTRTARSSLLFAALLCLICSTFANAETRSQEQSQEELERLKKNIAQLSSWLDNANKEKTGLVAQLKQQEIEISKTSKAIRATQANITQTLKELQSLQAELQEHKRSLKEQQVFLTQELQALYLEGRQPVLKKLLDSDSPQSSARQLAYFHYLKEARDEKMTRYEQTVAKLEETEVQILQRQTRLQSSKDELEKQKTQLELQNIQRKKTLNKLQASISSKSEQLNKLEEDRARLENLLIEVEQAISKIELPHESSPFSKQKTKLPWPARGKVVERFGSRFAQGKLRSNGLRIVTSEGDAIRAVHYGRVVFSDWLRGFGLLIIVDHGEGYMSLYGNNKSLLRETGDWVAAGEELAFAGRTGGLTQSSLYFEIRHHGEPQNPLKWLRK